MSCTPGKSWSAPLHVRPQPGQSEALLLVATKDILEQPDHGVLIEASGPQVSILPTADLELTALLGGFRIDTDRRQTVQSLGTLLVIENEERLVAVSKPSFTKGRRIRYSSSRLSKNAQT
jgi:hypothetical protein